MASDKKLIRFATRDGGWVFVDPETDKVVRVVKGKRRSLPANTDWAHDTGMAARYGEAAGAAAGLDFLQSRNEPLLVTPEGRPLNGSPSNNRGNTIIQNPSDWVPLPLVVGEFPRAPQLIMQTQRNKSEGSEDICVTLGTAYVNEEAPFLNTSVGVNVLRHTALLEWGLGNASFQVEIDWDRGKTVTLCANYVQVVAKTTAVISLAAAGALPPIEALSAGVGYGRGGGSRQGLKLTSIALNGTVGPNLGTPRINASESTKWVDIPLFATHFGLAIGAVDQVLPITDALIQVSSNDAGFARDEVNYFYQTNQSTGNQGPLFPIPNPLKRINVINRSLNDWTRCNIIFYLAL
jgi:hypothetical protein